jgi:glycosyltransferase involved in cell wall biosynthesis
MLAPVVERVPPKKYGGTERVIHALTEELIHRGHDVTLFASGDSSTSARLVSIYPRGLREARLKELYGFNYWTLLNLGTVYESENSFDVIHDHVIPISLPTANIARKPVVATMHGPFTPESRRLFQTLKRPGIVTISRSQAQPVPGMNHVGTVYNGLPMNDYPFQEKPDDFLLFVGRLSPEKGVHFAIEVAQQLDMQLIIAAKLEQGDLPYFREEIEHHLSERIRWIGEVNEEERNTLMSKARATMHPVTWREPFGLTIIEAMACGSPVIAFNRGSIPELIRTGETGFVVEDVEAMIDAVANIESIDRTVTRDYARQTFSVKNMTDEYEVLYEKMLTGEKFMMDPTMPSKRS